MLLRNPESKDCTILGMDFSVIKAADENVLMMVVYLSNGNLEKYEIREPEYMKQFSRNLPELVIEKDLQLSFSDPSVKCCLSDDADQLVVGSTNTLYWESVVMSFDKPQVLDMHLTKVSYSSKKKTFILFDKTKHDFKVGTPAKGFKTPFRLDDLELPNPFDFAIDRDENHLIVASFKSESEENDKPVYGFLCYDFRRVHESIVDFEFLLPLPDGTKFSCISMDKSRENGFITAENGIDGAKVQLWTISFDKKTYQCKETKIMYQQFRTIDNGPDDLFLWVRTENGSLLALDKECEYFVDFGIKEKNAVFAKHRDYFALNWDVFRLNNPKKHLVAIKDDKSESTLLHAQIFQNTDQKMKFLMTFWASLQTNHTWVRLYDLESWKIMFELQNTMRLDFNLMHVSFENNNIKVCFYKEGRIVFFCKNQNPGVPAEWECSFLNERYDNSSWFSQLQSKPWQSKRYYIFQTLVLIPEADSIIKLEHTTNVLDAKISQNTFKMATITEEWMIYIWDIAENSIISKMQVQENTKLIGFMENDSYLMTDKELIKIASIERILLFLSLLQCFNSFAYEESVEANEGAFEASILKTNLPNKNFIIKALKFGSLPDHRFRPIDFFKKSEAFLDKLFVIMSLLQVDFADFPYQIHYKNFLQRYEHVPKGEILKNCVDKVNLACHPRVPQVLEIKTATVFQEEIENETFNEIIEQQLWKTPNNIFLQLKKDQIYALFIPKSEEYSEETGSKFMEYYKKYVNGLQKVFNWKSVRDAFYSKILSPQQIFDHQGQRSTLQRVWYYFFFMGFCTVFLFEIPIMILFLFSDILAILWGFFPSWRFRSPEKNVKLISKHIEIRKLHLPNLFDVIESKDFLSVLAKKPPFDPMFQNFYIKSILNCKWVDVRNDFMVDMIEFIYFVFLLTLETVFLQPYRSTVVNHGFSVFVTIMVLVLGHWQLILEIMELKKVGPTIYRLGGIWNFFDWMVIIFTIPALLLDITDARTEGGLPDESKNAMKILMSLAIMFSYLKLLGYSRGFDRTSFLIRIFIQVFGDMVNFIMLLFYIMLAMSFAG